MHNREELNNNIENKLDISIIIPVYNEEENLRILVEKIIEDLKNLQRRYEIIFIDDGSKDRSFEVLKELSYRNSSIRIIRFRKNAGQTAAVSAGIRYSKGEIIIPMDADLQNDSKDIPRLLEKIDQGYDVVSGWRKTRYDKLLTRKIPSWVANGLISFITKVKLHDCGCALKAYKKEFIKDIHFYGEMFPFIPAYAVWQGAKITELEVSHHSRKYGKTKYGLSRIYKTILDLLVVKFLTNYLDRPIHFFGGIGLFSLFISFLGVLAAVILKVIRFANFIETPLPLFSTLFFIVGIIFILMGVLAEIVTRTYHESQQKYPYSIKEKINF